MDGDGNWQTIVFNLDGINGFELVASIRGKKGSGRYALAHAIALSAFGVAPLGIKSNVPMPITETFSISFLFGG